MKQSRATSLFKSLISTAVGFGVAMAANALVLPLFGFHPSLSENLIITVIYTAVSIARGYVLERVFEAMFLRARMSAFAMAAILAEGERHDRNRKRKPTCSLPTHRDDDPVSTMRIVQS